MKPLRVRPLRYTRLHSHPILLYSEVNSGNPGSQPLHSWQGKNYNTIPSREPTKCRTHISGELDRSLFRRMTNQQIFQKWECTCPFPHILLFTRLFSLPTETWTQKKNQKPKVPCLIKNFLMMTVNLPRNKGLEENVCPEFLPPLVLAITPDLICLHQMVSSVGASMD